jgi:ABC-2 type transport system permease protein
LTVTTPSRGSLVSESVIFAGRLFGHWRRYPVVPIQAVLFPTVLLITYGLLVSKSMTRITGTNSLEVLIPICAVAGAMSGSLSAALAIPYERDSGLLSRFWIMPVHRASALCGTLLAEVARTLVGTGFITAVSLAFGFRFHGSFLALIAFLLVPVSVVVIYTTVVISIAVRSQTRALLTWLGTGSIGLVFGSVAPIERIPVAVRPIAAFQPMKPPIDAMRALAQGGNAIPPLLLGFVWFVALAAVFGPLAIRGYRSAATSRG